MSEQEQLVVIGAVTILVGIVWAWIGDKEIPVKGGVILKVFGSKPGQVRYMKWLMGGALICVGIAILRKGLA